MAKITNTFTTADGNLAKEEFSNVVDMVAVQDTPLYSMMSKEKCTSTNPRWATVELETPGENIQSEGDTYSFDEVAAGTKLGNHTQIMRKTFLVSATQQAINDAGNVESMEEIKVRRGVELRKDVELAIVTNNASVAGETREFGGLPTWIETNVDRGSGGSNGGYNTGTGLTTAATNGTQRAFSKSIMDDTMQDCYTNGADVRDLVVSPYVKSVFVTFMSDSNVAQYRYAATSGEGNSLVANVDMYEGPFGKISIHPNRVMATSAGVARNAFFVDRSKLCFKWLRPIKEDTEAQKVKTSDGHKGVLICEGTLGVKNEKGLGVAADIYGLTAAS